MTIVEVLSAGRPRGAPGKAQAAVGVPGNGEGAPGAAGRPLKDKRQDLGARPQSARVALVAAVFLVAQLTCVSQSSWGSPPEDDASTGSSPSPKGALLRSAAYPGWGQLANGKPYKACAIMAVEAYFVGVALSSDRRASDAGELVGGTATQAEVAAYEEKRAYYEDRRNAHLWWMGATILYSMLDAYVDASLAGVGKGFSEPPPVMIEARSDRLGGVGLAIVARF